MHNDFPLFNLVAMSSVRWAMQLVSVVRWSESPLWQTMPAVRSPELSSQQLVQGTAVGATQPLLWLSVSTITKDTILATSTGGLIIATIVLAIGTGGPITGEITLATAAGNSVIKATVLASFNGSIIGPSAPSISVIELLLQWCYWFSHQSCCSNDRC